MTQYRFSFIQAKNASADLRFEISLDSRNYLHIMIVRKLVSGIALVSLLPIDVPEAKRRKQSSNHNKFYRTRRQECTRTTCKNWDKDDDNCAFKCISEQCYEQIYATNMLELGEVDKPREDRFITCVNGEAESKRRAKMREKTGSEL